MTSDTGRSWSLCGCTAGSHTIVVPHTRGVEGCVYEPTAGRSRTVWVYADPASGNEISDVPSIGRAVEVPVDLLERFEAARRAFDDVAADVADLLSLAESAAARSQT